MTKLELLGIAEKYLNDEITWELYCEGVDAYTSALLKQCNVGGSFFKEIVIMKADGVVLKRLQTIDHIPKTNNLIYIDGKRYQVTSNVFDYDLECIKIWVSVEC